MKCWSSIPFIVITSLTLALAMFAQSAWAKCSDTRVQLLADDGSTLASIAATCNMSKAAIRRVLSSSDEASESESSESESESESDKPRRPRDRGLKSGTPVGQCGCWGPADPNYEQPHAGCRSGYATPKMCNFACPAGGFAWRGVCT